jgi:CMP-N,N'-diacetyllegionaminic acid synthase
MRVAIVVPARKGSKGIKNKNRKEINGLSLFSRAIELAIEIKKAIDVPCNIIPATDDEQLRSDTLEINTPYIRSEHLSGDRSTMFELLSDICSSYQKEHFTDLIILQPTTPQRTLDAFLKLWRQYLDERTNIGCMCSVSPVSQGINELIVRDQTGRLQPLEVRISDIRRQEFHDELLYDDGAFYVVRVSEMFKQNVSLPHPMSFFDTGLKNVVDIDDEADLIIARALMKSPC